MKPQLTFVLLLFCFSLTAQVKLKVKLLPDNVTYQVVARPDATFSAPNNIVTSGQITPKVPTGGFAAANLANLAGTWTLNPMAVAPVENPTFDYIFIGWQGSPASLTLEEGVELPLFSFKNTGACTGEMVLYENGSDPFAFPNNFGIDPAISFIAFGQDIYTGNYSVIPANCKPDTDCGIEVWDVNLVSPSACGVADGVITMDATSTAGFVDYTITYGTPQVVWQPGDGVFPNLAAGDIFYLAVRDFLGCEIYLGEFELAGPLAAVITGVDVVQPDCGGTNGSVTIHAIPQNGGSLQYALSETGPWQVSNVFSGLAEGSYSFWVRDIVNVCQNFVGNYDLNGCEEPDCLLTFDFERLATGEYQVSLISDTTWIAPNNFTSSLNVTIKVPTGGFVISNLTNLVPNTAPNLWNSASIVAPAEDPAHDYLVFGLGNFTSEIVYQTGVKFPLFKFENGGPCQGGSVFLMENDDPIINNPNENASNYVSVFGSGGPDIIPCLTSEATDDCNNDPCAALVPGFTTADVCFGDTVHFTNTTTSIEPITSWNWSFGDTKSSNIESPSHIYSTSGNFEVSLTVTTESGCQDTLSGFVTVFSSPGLPAVTSYSTCNGIGVTLEGPAGATTATWNPTTDLDLTDPVNPVATPSSTTVYSVTYGNGTSCETTAQITVTVANKPLFVSVTPSNPTDCNIQNGSIVINATGAGSLEYSIDNVTWQPGATFSNLGPGSYNVFARNAGGSCPAAYNGNPVIITAPLQASITNVTSTNPTACGANDGTITITATGGNGPLLYSIDGGTTTQASGNFTNLGPGTYNVSVSNNDGSCEVVGQTVVLTDPPISISNVSSTNLTGCGANNGTITITASGGNGSLNYSINGGTTTQASGTFTNLAAGTYNVAVSNSNGSCLVTGQSVVISNPPSPTVSPVNDFNLCVGSSSQLNIQLSEPIASYTITGTGAHTSESINGNSLSMDVSAVLGSNNTYNVILTGASGCTATENFTVTGLALPSASFTHSATLCTNGEITFNFNGIAGVNAAYTWSFGTGQVTFSSPDNKTKIVTYATEGTKTVCLDVTDNGCTDNFCMDLNVAAFNPGAATAVTDASCGLNNGAINLNLTGGGNYTYKWSPGNATTQNISSLAAGTYTVTITETGSGCSATSSAIVGSSTNVNINNVTLDQPSGCGSGDGSITVQVSGGTANYSFNLYKAGQPALVDQFSGTMTSVTFPGLAPGAWKVEVVDANGCIDAETRTLVSANTSISVLPTTTLAGCGQSNGTASLVISGGDAPYTYTFYKNNTLLGQDLPINSMPLNISNLEPATYVAIVEDANGCIQPVVVNIESQQANFAVTAAETDPSCGANDGSILLSSLPNGATLVWYNSDGDSISNSNPLTGVGPDVYSVAITGGNGCSQTNNYALSSANGASISMSAMTAATCGQDNGSVTFSVSGFNSYHYEILNAGLDGNAAGSAPVQITGLGKGAYVIQVEDLGLSDCVALEVFTIAGEDAIQTNSIVTSASACGVEDASVCIEIIGGEAPYTLPAPNMGTVVPGSANNKFCIEGLYEGTVNLTIIDNAGCQDTMAYLVTNSFDEPSLTADSVEVAGYTCPGELGSIVSMTGDTYEVLNAGGSVVGITPWIEAPAGNYTLRYSSGDCTVTLPVSVDGPANWSTGIANQTMVSCAGNDGSIEVSVAGGTFPYTFAWSNGDSTESLSNVGEGSYSVTITDANGCTTLMENLTVASDCQDQPCESVFLTDTFFVALVPGLTEICLPTELPSLSGYLLTLDGGLYAEAVDVCVSSTLFYGYSQLNSLQSPFILEEWNANGQKITGLNFSSVAQLVNIMNDFDPLGNWTNADASSGIIGGSQEGNYGQLVIRHESTGTTFILMPDGINVERPSIFVEDNPQAHVFIVLDPFTQCLDTLYINLVQPDQPQSENVDVTVNVGESVVICISAEELAGNIEFQPDDVCESFVSNALIVNMPASQTVCPEYALEIQGVSEGTQEACIVLCDDLGVCDTTFLHINVLDNGGSGLVIYNGFSPNEDGFNDYFRIKNIELEKYKDNSLVVFNRWGNRVYSADGYTNSNPWKAVYKGTFLPDGTYFYVLEINEIQDNGTKEKKVYKGMVEVRK